MVLRLIPALEQALSRLEHARWQLVVAALLLETVSEMGFVVSWRAIVDTEHLLSAEGRGRKRASDRRQSRRRWSRSRSTSSIGRITRVDWRSRASGPQACLRRTQIGLREPGQYKPAIHPSQRKRRPQAFRAVRGLLDNAPGCSILRDRAPLCAVRARSRQRLARPPETCSRRCCARFPWR